MPDENINNNKQPGTNVFLSLTDREMSALDDIVEAEGFRSRPDAVRTILRKYFG